MKTISTILVLTALLVGCETKTDTVIGPPPLTTMQQVILNVETIDDALTVYAAAHDGHYPTYFDQENWDLFDLRTVLPDSLPLRNPVTGQRTEPRHVDEVHPNRPAGSVIYTPYCEYDAGSNWVSTGYTLAGIDPDGGDYVLDRLPGDAYDRFERVRDNCAIVLTAAENFANDNAGVYPSDVGTDVNSLGKTLEDYLPQGILLENPVALVRVVPIDGAAAQWGETGYWPVDADENGSPDGCTVDGYGTLLSEYFVLYGGAAAQ